MDGKLTVLVSLKREVLAKYFSNMAWTSPATVSEYIGNINKNWGAGIMFSTQFDGTITYSAYLNGKYRLSNQQFTYPNFL